MQIQVDFQICLFLAKIQPGKMDQWQIQRFPIGGRGPHRGAMDSRGGYVSKILYVKTKEFGTLVGHVPGTPPLDPAMWMLPEFTQRNPQSQSGSRINTHHNTLFDYILH